MSQYNIIPAGPGRSVLHVDMDAFFASVAQVDDPALRGRPVIVGGTSLRRGVVTSASYEARAYGVRSAMPLYQALERCPHAVVVPGAFERYREVNRQLRAIWARHAPVVEVASFDEAYLELTGCEALLGDPAEVARAIQRDVLAETGVTCSVGVASSKLLAKVASKRHKPRGLCVVPRGEEAAWLAPLAIGDLHGVGPATAKKLAEVGLVRVGQLLEVPEDQLERYLGPGAAALRLMAQGIDTRPVSPHGAAKSIGAETTFDRDVASRERLAAVFRDLVQEVAFRARRAGVLARTVAVKVRYHDFETIGRARTLVQATDDDDAIAAAALALFAEHAEPGRPVRLVGVTLSQFTTVAQLSLLAPADTEEKKALNVALDRLRERHGLFVVSRGTHLGRRRRGA